MMQRSPAESRFAISASTTKHRRTLRFISRSPPTGTNLGHTLYELALIDQRAKAPGEAAKKLERLVREVPDYPSMDKVLYELGWSLQESGDDDEAVKHFATLIANYPETSLIGEASYFVGQKHYGFQTMENRGEAIRDRLPRTPATPISRKRLITVSAGRASKRPTTVRRRKRLRTKPSDTPDGKLSFDAVMMIGECRFKQADFKRALAGYESARELIRENDDSSATIRDDSRTASS